nr:reverse transcriptase domain-containing protein [Tanacetum cinerariifolium]
MYTDCHPGNPCDIPSLNQMAQIYLGRRIQKLNEDINRRSNRRRVPNIVEPEIRTIEEIVSMANRTMEELLQAPTEGYGEAIVISEILAENFEIKTNFLQLVQAKKFHGSERDNPHTHISNFKRMTATLKDMDVPNDAIKLVLFPYSLEGAARIWYEKEPPNSILTWDDIVNKFVNQFFLPSKTTHLKNEISRFTQRFEETFGEAWDRFKEMLRACPYYGFSELTQIDTFYNGLTEQDQDSLNAAAGVEIVNKKVITPASTKAVEKTCVTCGGAHSYYDCIATDSNQPSVRATTGSYNQEENLRRNLNNDMRSILGSFFQNHASTSGTLPSNIVPNPKGEMKVITTRSGLAYEGPSIPTNSPLEKVNEQNTEEIMDKEHSNCPGSTTQIQPPVVPISILEPDVPRTQTKPTIPYPSRLNDQKLREKATNQIEKSIQIFHDLHFDISFADALLLMPKFASTIKSLLTNKDKLFELAKVPLNENCSAMLFKKLPEKLGDPGKFLIPCDFPRMEVCHALADLGASINLMPLSIWKKLSLPELTPTRMTLELADRSITHPKGVAEDVFVKVGKFHFPIDFVVVDFEADPRVPLILGRSFLRTGRALIDVYGKEITIRYNPKSSNPTLVFDPLIPENDFCKEPIVKSSSPTLTPFGESDFFLEEIKDFLNDDSIPAGIENSLYDPEGDILFLEKLLNEDPFQLPPMDLKLAEETKVKSSVEEPPELELKELSSHLDLTNGLLPGKSPTLKENIKLLDVGMIYPISDSPWVSPIHCMPKKGGMTVVANENNELISTRLVTGWRVCIDYRKLNDVTRKDHFLLPFMDQMLERLVGYEFYCFLDGFSGYFQIPIDPQDQEKTTFTCSYGTFAYHRMPFGLCNAPCTFQRCMLSIFHDMIEKTMEVFMDDFLVFGDSFSSCLTNLDNMLKSCEETNLVLNWEKCHFMCREGIVLGHKISKYGIEVDRTKVDVIAKLPHPTTVKGVRSFLGHAGFYRRFIQDLSKIARPMTHLLEKETPFVFSKKCVDAFNTLKKKLTEAPILVVPDWNLPFELMCDASDYAIGAVLRQRKTKYFQSIHYASKMMTEGQIHYTTSEKEMLAVVYAFEKFWPYLVLSKSIVYTNHSALKYFLNKQDAKPRLLRWVLLLQEFNITILDKKRSENLMADHLSRLENPHKDVLENKDINENFLLETLRSLSCDSTPWFDNIANFHAGNFIKKGLTSQQKKFFFKDLLISSKLAMRDLLGAIMVPITQRRREIISDRGTHFCNDQFTRVMIKYGVTHRLTTAYHPQTSGQVELVYGKLCHLPIELEHRAYWALKHVNFDLKTAGDHRKLQLNELSELRDQAYENPMIYKERTEKLHDSKIKNCIFNVGDQVLLFNSYLKIFSRKLKTRWSGPFTITQVFPYGTVELSQPKVNGHRMKHYFEGDNPSNVVLDLHTFPKDN